MVNTAHLMVFQEAIEDTNVLLIQLPYEMMIIKFPAPNVKELNMSKPPKFDDIKQSTYIPKTFNSLFFLWLCFRKWNEHHQAVAIFSGWLTQFREKHIPTITM